MLDRPATTSAIRRTRGPSLQKTELTRAEILNAALEEFTEVGIAKATMEKIAKRANLAKGTLYLHFMNKEALLQGALEATIAYSALASMNTPRMPNESVQSYITRLILPSMERFHASGRASLARLVLGEARSYPALSQFYYAQVFMPWHQRFERLFRIAQQEGELTSMSPAAASQLLGAPFWISLAHDAIVQNDSDPKFSPAKLTELQIQAIFGYKTST